MKAIVLWGFDGLKITLCDVEKVRDKKVGERLYESERFYDITKEYLSCKSCEVEFSVDNIKSIGHTFLSESKVYPITEEYFQEVLESREKVRLREKNDFKNLLVEYREAELIKQNEILDRILARIESIDNFALRHERYDMVNEMLDDIRSNALKKARETGEKQLISSRMVRCNLRGEQCPFDLINEYLTPEDEIETVRVHTS